MGRVAGPFDASARTSGGLISYYKPPDLFVEMVERVAAAGFTEIGLDYPTVASQLPSFERIASGPAAARRPCRQRSDAPDASVGKRLFLGSRPVMMPGFQNSSTKPANRM